MLLEDAHSRLGWPDPKHILTPTGAGAQVAAELVKLKIEGELKRNYPGIQIETGVLVQDSYATGTAAPLAIVCQFRDAVPPAALDLAHRLAWNFSRTSLLVTLERHRIIAWSCYRDPRQDDAAKRVCELDETTSTPADQRRAQDLLHWVSLLTGHIQQARRDHFPVNGRADALLLEHLKHVRTKLIHMDLSPDYCHDLLARVLFTQFLFHRKDREGNPFFNDRLLDRRCDGALHRVHRTLDSILRDHGEAYALFRWLDNRFNGDLFPGKADSTDDEREASWRAEKRAVEPRHLSLLADLISGTIDPQSSQLSLWPLYSFDTIPLEFISSVYEQFLNERKYTTKAFYTPPHLVDYALDAVLPWNGQDYNLRILDPSCGSGIFLVKAFQRLIHRWRSANAGRDPHVSDLKPILAKQLVGVDIDPDAVRVASFSLYLAMADAIEPKHYVTREKVFPRLRGVQLLAKDFFDEETPGIRTQEDEGIFDLVIGNAPWGEKSIQKTSEKAPPPENASGSRRKLKPRTKAEQWARLNKWPVLDNNIGPLFLAKGLRLLAEHGNMALLQPAGPWLYLTSEPAIELRRKLFTSTRVNEVTNFSAVRHELFPEAIGAACLLAVSKEHAAPDAMLAYVTPKPSKTPKIGTNLQLDPQDIATLPHRDAAEDPKVWPVLALGGPRDLNLVRKLGAYPTLGKLREKQQVLTREGIIPGDQKKELKELRGKRYLGLKQFPKGVFLELDAGTLDVWAKPFVHSLHSIGDYEAFKNPQLLIKRSYSVSAGRFRAALVKSADPEWGVVCKKTYLSVRDLSPTPHNIRAAWLSFNSQLALYFLALTSSRLGHNRTEPNTNELITVPLPSGTPDLSKVSTFEDIDREARRLFALTDAEWILVEDLVKVTFPETLQKTPGPGRKPTTRGGRVNEPELSAYGKTLSRVLEATFGPSKKVAIKIYQEQAKRRLPVRMMKVYFDTSRHEPLTVETMVADGLYDELTRLHHDALHPQAHEGGFGFQRVAFFFESAPGERSLTIIKPDELRYWTRSLAMRDADDLSFAILKAAGLKGGSA